MTNEHPLESIPAYVLGALDTEEALHVRHHLAGCSVCRAEFESFSQTLSMLPHLAAAKEPRPHVKQQLMARVAASQQPLNQLPTPAPPSAVQRPLLRRQPHLMSVVAACSLLLALLLGGLLYDAHSRAAQLQALVETQHNQIVLLEGRLEQEQTVVAFLAAPGTVGHSVAATERAPNARATAYVQEGHNRVVVLIDGLEPAASEQTYQLWLASEQSQVPANTFEVGSDGIAEVVFDAPEPIERYAQLMVTVERAGGADTPSDDVVLQTEL